MKYPLTVWSFHDLHFGHNNVPTDLAIQRWMKQMPHVDSMRNIDIIALPGDVFDHLLQLPDDRVWLIKRWVIYLLNFCKKYDILLLIVEGTPRHDWKQSYLFLSENEHIGAEVYYSQSIEVKYFEKYDINVLFVPDQMGTPEFVYSETVKVLAQAGLEKADICLLHGQFDYQFPEYLKIACHDSDKWNELVKHAIFSGHIHDRSQKDKILVAGSFDRHKHGEEGPKGFLKVRFEEQHTDIEWVENKEAHTFKTVRIKGLTTEEALDKIHEEVKELREGSYVRLFCLSSDSMKEGLLILRKTYPHLFFKIEEEDVEEKPQERTLEVVSDEFSAIEVTKENLLSLTELELKEKYPHLTQEEIDQDLALLKQFQ